MKLRLARILKNRAQQRAPRTELLLLFVACFAFLGARAVVVTRAHRIQSPLRLLFVKLGEPFNGADFLVEFCQAIESVLAVLLLPPLHVAGPHAPLHQD